MDLKDLLLLSAFIANALLGIFIYFRRRKNHVSRAFVFSIITIVLWTATTFFFRLSKSAPEAVLWCRLLYICVALVPYAFLYFTFLFPEEKISISHKKKLAIAAPVILMAIFCLLPKTVIYSVALRKTQESVITFGFMYPVYLSYIIAYFSWALLNLFLKLVKTSDRRIRMQIKYITAGIAVFCSAVFMANLIMPWFGGFNLSWWGPLSAVIYTASTAYAILKHRLTDIKVTIKNTLVYTALYGVSAGLFVATVAFLGQFSFYGSSAIDKKVLGIGLFALFVVIMMVRPLDRFLIKMANKNLFQRKYEYQKTLKEAAKGMSRITDSNKLFRMIVHFMSMRVKVNHVEIYYQDSRGKKYILQAGRGKDRGHEVPKISKDSAMVKWLEEKKDVLIHDEVEHWLEDEKEFPHKTVLRKNLEDIKLEMKKLDASICVPCFSKDKILGLLVLGDKLSGNAYTREDVDILSTVSHEAAVAIENAQLYEELYAKMMQIQHMYEKEKKLFISTAIAFATAIDAKDTYTHGHTERVTKYCVEIGNELKDMRKIRIPDNFDETLHVSALLHDVGKIGTPDHILNKKGPLTKEEYEEIKRHPTIGASIVEPIKELSDVVQAIRYHQERWDGKGYPAGLKGEKIPLYSRIIMVADAFDAMISDRPYRQRVMEEVAIQEIRQGAGTQFDPLLVEAFIRSYKKRNIINLSPKAKSQITEKKQTKHHHPMHMYFDFHDKDIKKQNDDTGEKKAASG